jgi:AcrR family transcriptional regulator
MAGDGAMVIRQRAMQAEDKRERYDAILDAAERVLLRSPDRVVNVADVALEAGLAKGTVYLYFPGKEELLLALHERNIDGFFRPLIERLESPAPVSVEDVAALTREYIVAPPLFLPLASRCLGVMAQAVPEEAAAAFHERMMTRLLRAGAGLERHFPQLEPGSGLALLRHSYALIIGLWQMYGAKGNALHCPMTGLAVEGRLLGLETNYPDELDRALSELWYGALARREQGDAR